MQLHESTYENDDSYHIQFITKIISKIFLIHSILNVGTSGFGHHILVIHITKYNAAQICTNLPNEFMPRLVPFWFSCLKEI